MTDTQAPRRVEIRDRIVLDALEEILEKLKTDGLTPPEAMMVAELLLWQLVDNLLKLAPPPAVEKLRAAAMRGVLRIESRIQAWPSKTQDKH